MILVPGKAYHLQGLHRTRWDNSHPEFGQPDSVAGRYLGWLRGNRTWHGFEVWAGAREIGVVFMTDDDLAMLKIDEVG